VTRYSGARGAALVNLRSSTLAVSATLLRSHPDLVFAYPSWSVMGRFGPGSRSATRLLGGAPTYGAEVDLRARPPGSRAAGGGRERGDGRVVAYPAFRFRITDVHYFALVTLPLGPAAQLITATRALHRRRRLATRRRATRAGARSGRCSSTARRTWYLIDLAVWAGGPTCGTRRRSMLRYALEAISEEGRPRRRRRSSERGEAQDNRASAPPLTRFAGARTASTRCSSSTEHVQRHSSR